jgi:8-amino-7-oxononanoate synthase
MYSTAAPPSLAEALETALTIVESEPDRRNRVVELASALRARLARRGLTPADGGHIIPIVLGDSARSSAVAASLADAGFDVRAIRPPTVLEGTSRLRVSINSRLDETTLERFAGTLEVVLEQVDRAGVVAEFR